MTEVDGSTAQFRPAGADMADMLVGRPSAGRRRAVIAAVAVLACVCAVGAWRSTTAAFSAASAAPNAQWVSGSTVLAATSGVLTVSGAVPGSFGTGCASITYTGSLPATVRMYLRGADVGGTGLAPYLTMQIDSGTGTRSDCADFTPVANLWNPAGFTDTTRTATAFSTASSDYATGVDNWAATTSATRTYRIGWQLQDDNAARARTASLTFTWEAQSS